MFYLALKWFAPLLAVAQPAASSRLEFEVASVKPANPEFPGTRIMNMPGGKLSISNMTLKNLIEIAYQVRDFQVAGGPSWIGSEHFDIEAKADEPARDIRSMTESERKESQKRFNERLQSLMADRFQLVVREEQKEMPVYALLVAKSGSKLKPTADAGGLTGITMRRSAMEAKSAPVESLTEALSNFLKRPVVDKTGLQGKFDWKLEWAPEQPTASTPGTSGDIFGPSLSGAVQEQLGLRLESQKAPARLIVVESVARPSAN